LCLSSCVTWDGGESLMISREIWSHMWKTAWYCLEASWAGRWGHPGPCGHYEAAECLLPGARPHAALLATDSINFLSTYACIFPTEDQNPLVGHKIN
jgi:hypothetical protein